MPLGCLTYSHRLCMSRKNRNILWPLCAKRTELRTCLAIRCAKPEFAMTLLADHAEAGERAWLKSEGVEPGRFAATGRFCTLASEGAIGSGANGT